MLHLHSRIYLAPLASLTLLERVFKPFLPSSPHQFSPDFPPTSPQTHEMQAFSLGPTFITCSTTNLSPPQARKKTSYTSSARPPPAPARLPRLSVCHKSSANVFHKSNPREHQFWVKHISLLLFLGLWYKQRFLHCRNCSVKLCQ